MERRVAPIKIGCQARVHMILNDGRFLTWRCRDNRCPDVMAAKEHGKHVFHVFDLESGKRWTDLKDPHTRGTSKRSA